MARWLPNQDDDNRRDNEEDADQKCDFTFHCESGKLGASVLSLKVVP